MTEEVQARFDQHGVPSSPYRTVKAAMTDPQLAHRRAFAEINDAGGRFRALNPPFRMSDTPAAASPHVGAADGDWLHALPDHGSAQP
jgi:crotonobetainyl-CoA:carnitine CoA-transferase CaiB-like acyl-CoA transferase